MDDKKSQLPEKKTGIAHFFAAARYSLQGLKFMTGEVPFRHEVAALTLILFMLLFLGASALTIILTFSFGIATIAIEAVNSAIELIIDRTSPEISNYAKNAKDVGSFAVACMMIATGAIAGFGAYSTL